jgi:hypothetical protein
LPFAARLRYFGIDIADFSLCDQAQARLLTSHAQLMVALSPTTNTTTSAMQMVVAMLTGS